MKLLICLSLLVTVVSAGTLTIPKPRLPLFPAVDSPQELEGRITNGHLAEPGQFPYQAGLSIIIGKDSFWCGGTVISDRWILTAAHCTDGADSVTVYLGAINIRNSTEKGQHRIFVSKKNIIVHEKYGGVNVGNDISLIKLPVVIEFNDRIQPATLPKKNGQYSTYVDEMVWASGWGRESDAATGSTPLLRYIEVPIMKQSTCNGYYFGTITDSMICISTKGKTSTCNGDSGGPLVYKDGDINYVIGATSFGITLGCEKGWPGVFTRITSYLDWIEDHCGLVNK